jgi:ComF family protein
MLKNLIKIFFPKSCLSCAEILLDNENSICITCRHSLPYTNFILNPENEGIKIFYGRINVKHFSALFFYYKNGAVQKLIHNLKYKNHQEIGKLFANWYIDDLKANQDIKTIDIIVPVPLHKKRFKQRGYNQVTTFGKTISEGLDKHFDASILARSKHAITQSKKNRSDRNLVSEDTFEVIFSEKHHNKHFLLIDDVLTTGATLEACGKAILKIPGAELSIVTMAYSK